MFIHSSKEGVTIDDRSYPDIQNMTSERYFILSRVGITGLKKPTVVQRKGKVINLIPTFDVYVDLPAHQKGSHMSRNAEVINDIVDQSVRSPVESLEKLGENIVDVLLAKHDYATYTQVDMESDYFIEKCTPLGRKSLENYRIRASVRKSREGGTTRILGVEVVGMTVCPCAMETTREMLSSSFPEKRALFHDIPVISHNQRNVSSIEMELNSGTDVEADDLIEIIELSQSSPTFEILKRSDEGRVVLDAHENPKFVEDVVRDILHHIIQGYPDLHGETKIKVRSISEESIHKHNALAERITTLEELRR